MPFEAMLTALFIYKHDKEVSMFLLDFVFFCNLIITVDLCIDINGR